MKLLELILKHASQDRRARFRDRRAFYASQAMGDLRDLYWEMTGVEPTEKIDFIGKSKMMAGSGVEYQLVKEYISDLHWYGLHSYGAQVPVGSSNPNIDGNLDGLMSQKLADGTYETYVLEIKTKSGYGADLFASNPIPSEEYMAQLGLYIKDLYEKKICSKGCFLFVLLSDKSFGTLIQIDCHYDADTTSIVATRATYSNGQERELDYAFNLQTVFDRLKYLEECVKTKVVPPASYQYKFLLTAELLAEQRDYTLKNMLQGVKILGDWQARYSKFLTHNLKLDNVSREYNSEELALIRKEYLLRHPKSKL